VVANYSGTGNTLNAATPWMRRLLLDGLRYWVTEMHVDGFRFDVASALARQSDGSLNFKTPLVFAEIAADPELADIRTTWTGLPRHSLDTVERKILRSGQALCARRSRPRRRTHTRIYGSDDLFPRDAKGARHPYQSVNDAVSHDGFTLYDTRLPMMKNIIRRMVRTIPMGFPRI